MEPIENQIESRLLDNSQGFEQVYIQVKSLFNRVAASPETITRQTLDALLFVIRSDCHLSQKQHYFLCKEAAEILIFIAVKKSVLFAGIIIGSLRNLLTNTSGKRRRAISEALGTLPLRIKGPKIFPKKRVPELTLEFQALLGHLDGVDISSFSWHGRTLRFLHSDGSVVSVKFAKSRENISQIELEAQWLLYLKQHMGDDRFFKIPSPVLIDDHCVYKLVDLPGHIRKGNRLSTDYPAIVFTTHNTYYQYPNDAFKQAISSQSIQDVYCQNARLLGEMLASGIIHTALIPLFHNRIQQTRRNDGGVYLWEHGGRLDKWLESCRYPNLSVSGLRDFEHLVPVRDTASLHHYLGEHLLGFFLVMGSTFRNIDPQKKGWDEHKTPMDMTHLFDADFFYATMQGVIIAYFKAVTGKELHDIEKIFPKKLIFQLINAMGVDHHMEETLRIGDQLNMDEQTFYDFLVSRGVDEQEISAATRGKADITLTSGPHLGGFNQPISVPGLIEFLFCFSAICMAERYLYENGLKGVTI